jgi:hypothetical protein
MTSNDPMTIIDSAGISIASDKKTRQTSESEAAEVTTKNIDKHFTKVLNMHDSFSSD